MVLNADGSNDCSMKCRVQSERTVFSLCLYSVAHAFANQHFQKLDDCLWATKHEQQLVNHAQTPESLCYAWSIEFLVGVTGDCRWQFEGGYAVDLLQELSCQAPRLAACRA